MKKDYPILPQYRKSMDQVWKPLVPMLYPDTPSFLGVPLATGKKELEMADAAVVGVPDQGLPRAGQEYVDSVQTPGRLRKDSLKYGGYLPELDIDVFEEVRLVDYGDVLIPGKGDVLKAIGATQTKLAEVLTASCLAISLGGTEICASLGLVKAAARAYPGKVGIITLDAHGDNLKDYSGERWCAATWIARMAEIPGIDLHRHAHIGLRGPRNTKEQVEWFRKKGTALYTMTEVKKIGMDRVMEQVLDRVAERSRALILSVDLDVLDIGCAPGLDEPLGIYPEDLFKAAYQVGSYGVKGFSLGWIPSPSPAIHWIATWTILYLLAGLARSGTLKKRS